MASRLARGAWGRHLAAAMLGTLLVAAMAQAAISWSSQGSLATGVAPSPVAFTAGAGASNTRYFSDFALSANQTSFTGAFKAKPGADSGVRDVVRVTNVDDATRTVTLRANQVSNAQFEAFTWTVKDGGSVVAVFDYRTTTPTSTLTMTSGKVYTLDLRVDLADGAGRHNAATTLGLWLEVS